MRGFAPNISNTAHVFIGGIFHLRYGDTLLASKGETFKRDFA